MFTRIWRIAALLVVWSVSVRAELISFSFRDPAGDSAGPIDVTRVNANFDNVTGAYRVLLSSSASNPFLGHFRVNLNLFNPDLGTNAQFPSFLPLNLIDFNLVTAQTTLELTGVDARLSQWEAGQRVATNNVPFGNPSGVTQFASAVSVLPFSAPDDFIAPGAAGFTTMRKAGESPSAPILPVIRPGFFQCLICSSGGWIDPEAAYGYTYQMLGGSLFTGILDFPTGFSNQFMVVADGVILGSFGPGQGVTFPGSGTVAFTILGIEPAVDSTDPGAFPLRLAFNTPTASFAMTPISTPEPAPITLLSLGLVGIALIERYRRRSAGLPHSED